MARTGENIYKRKDGRYEGRYIQKYDANGKPKWGYIYGKTYVETKEKLTLKKADAKNTQTVISSGMKLNDWIDVWLDTQRQIKQSTRTTYLSLYKNHIRNSIGRVPLKKLHEEQLQNFVDDETENFSAKTVHSVFSMLKLALEAAHKKRYIGNIYSDIRLPKVKQAVLRVLTPLEQRQLERVLLENESRYDIGILLCLYTGLRIGELCALRWENIDLKNAVITVEATAQRVVDEDKNSTAKTKIQFADPKSLSSIRIIPIPRALAVQLRKYQRDSGYILRDNGKYADVRNVSRRFKAVLAKAGLPDLNFHILRHTFATRALELGFDVKTLSEILGHSSVTITLNLYAHSLPEHKRKEMEKFSKLLQTQSD